MFETIQFLFSNFWYWLGGLIYLALVVAAVVEFKVVEINHDKEMNEEEFLRILTKYSKSKDKDEDKDKEDE